MHDQFMRPARFPSISLPARAKPQTQNSPTRSFRSQDFSSPAFLKKSMDRSVAGKFRCRKSSIRHFSVSREATHEDVGQVGDFGM